MRYTPIDKSLFIQNRVHFARAMKADSIAIFHSNDHMPRNGDQFFPYRQNADFFYLTGIEQAGSVLTIFPGAPREDMRVVLFLEKGDDRTTTWEGTRLDKKTARARSGINKIYWLEQMPRIIQELIYQARRIYVNTNENTPADSAVKTKSMRAAQSLLERYPFHKYHRSPTILRQLRMIKSPMEIDLMRSACQITHRAFEDVLTLMRPGLYEYQVEAQIISSFISQGATGHAYEPIVASGASACVLHYTSNHQVCQEGELVLLDFGADYAHYAADLSRTIPVSGRFSQRQRQVYDAVLRVHHGTRDLMVPGMTLDELNKEVGKIMSHELAALGLIGKKQVDTFDSEDPAYRKYFMHGISHHIGMDVHDLSDRYAPLQEGMVLSCEPGIYIKEEGMGIRIENNILVTDRGPIDLMAEVPIEAEDIEERMYAAALS